MPGRGRLLLHNEAWVLGVLGAALDARVWLCCCVVLVCVSGAHNA